MLFHSSSCVALLVLLAGSHVLSLPRAFDQIVNVVDLALGRDSAKQRCFGELGCFSRKDYQGPLSLPSVFLPKSPEDMNLTFSLYTDHNPYNAVELKYNFTQDEIRQTSFNSSSQTTVIIHGWMSGYEEMDWMGALKDLLVRKHRIGFNVIAVNWQNGAKSINYFKSVANTRVVGAATAFFLKRLHQFTGLQFSQIHIIGHSLGAHAAGFAGKEIQNPRVERITGLDPAGPSFNKDDPTTRLDKNDATYVEAIHTNMARTFLRGYGIRDQLGDVDFYPNGGQSQPDCGYTKTLFNVAKKGLASGISETLTCDHSFAFRLIRTDPELLTENCQFVGYQCESYKAFIQGKCHDCGEDNSKCSVISIWGADDKRSGLGYKLQAQDQTGRKKLYYKTRDQLPYCLHHYAVTVSFDKGSSVTTGTVLFSIDGETHNIKKKKLTKIFEMFRPGKALTFLTTTESSFGKIRQAKITYRLGGISSLNPVKWFVKPRIRVKSVEVRYMSNIDPRVRDRQSTFLCPIKSEEKNTIELRPCK